MVNVRCEVLEDSLPRGLGRQSAGELHGGAALHRGGPLRLFLVACLAEEFRVKHGPLTSYLDSRYHLLRAVLREEVLKGYAQQLRGAA